MSSIHLSHSRRALLLLLGTATLLIAAACGLQDSIVYQPQPYPFPRSAIPSQIRELDFKTGEGAQQAYYVPPHSGNMDTLWVLFNGNAGSALGWTAWVNQYPDANAGFLLIEYPGYGNSEGHPGAKAILESSEQAFNALAADLHADPADLWSKTSLLGHSLGCAEALQFAAKHNPGQVVLVAPFTSLRAIGELKTSSAAGSIINNEYDNVARLKELGARPPPLQVQVHIVHGADDEVIPVALGRELAKAVPGIDYQEVPKAHHNDILYVGRVAIYKAMGRGELAAQAKSGPDRPVQR